MWKVANIICRSWFASAGVHSYEVKLLSGFGQLVAEPGMRELDQFERALGRGQALETYGHAVFFPDKLRPRSLAPLLGAFA